MIPKLIIADSEHNSNMFYAVGMLIPDDFVYLENNGKKIIYIDDLEYNRVKKEAKVDRVVCYSEYASGVDRDSFGNILTTILKDNKIKKVQVPGDFNMKYAKILLDDKIGIEVCEYIFQNREYKNNNEIEKIVEVQRVNEKVLNFVIEIIRKSRVRKDGKLSQKNKILTSEFIKNAINIEFLKNNCISDSDLSLIVSCGKDSADPHEEGRGPIFANKPIIIDLSPKSRTNRYYADMTRTIVKGKASLEMKKMYNAVLGAQTLALGEIKEGMRADSIHKKVQDYFESKGFKTEEKNGKIQGFFHSTGHGVGLDIHESPRINLNYKKKLKAGNVVTVEPGLYYPEIGGVRIEDLVVVTKTGCKNLTKFPKFLEIK
ncbi:MAG: aminopeptidase P family protein [Candidatus Pacebacteria bacterium]|nr:aminopeptidase P family protein [Candidatus Paceibacterota bacterium]